MSLEMVSVSLSRPFKSGSRSTPLTSPSFQGSTPISCARSSRALLRSWIVATRSCSCCATWASIRMRSTGAILPTESLVLASFLSFLRAPRVSFWAFSRLFKKSISLNTFVTLYMSSWVVKETAFWETSSLSLARPRFVQSLPPSNTGIFTLTPVRYWSLLKVGGLAPKAFMGTTTWGSLSLS